MGHVVDVDPDRVDEMAHALATVGDALARAAQGAAHAWRRAAAGSGSPELRAAAEESASRWGTDLDVTSQAAGALCSATALTAAAYRDVEQSLTRPWSGRTQMVGRAAKVMP